MKRILNRIGARLIEPANRKFLPLIEPATGKAYAKVPDGDAKDVDSAVEAAKRAFPLWSETPAAERSKVLLRIAEGIEANLETLARAESVDNGKPLSLARSVDIPRAAANFRFFATAILHEASQAHPMGRSALNYTLRRPHGVVGLISPWNLPLYLLTWKIAPALATGNTVVAKPSELTPMTAFLFSKLLRNTGLPDGALNIVHGTGAKAGQALVDHPGISAISFTGGTATGERIARSAAPSFKKLSLEMGGKNPNVVFADADLDKAVEVSVASSFRNQGQICLCGSRILVEKPVFEEFVSRLAEKARGLVVGDPLQEGTEQGALVSEEHLRKVQRFVSLAKREGAAVEAGGKTETKLPARCKKGFFFQPTVLTGVRPDSKVNQEEIFGPVVTVTPFETETQALELANGTRYGLSATVWTRDLDRAHRFSERLEAGTVWINCWMLRDLRVPFGGTKDSGVGREGGEEALRFFTEPKNVCVAIDGGN